LRVAGGVWPSASAAMMWVPRRRTALTRHPRERELLPRPAAGCQAGTPAVEAAPAGFNEPPGRG
jgi:hypothetical protein